MLEICYFGITKAFNSNNSLNLVIKKGLQKNKFIVKECYAKPGLNIFKRFSSLIFQYFKYCRNCKVILVAEFGQTKMFLVKLIGLIDKKPVIFNPIVSLYDSYVLDRKNVKPNSFLAKKYFYLDKIAMNLADIVLVDTNEHLKYFQELFNLKKEKMKVMYVGADDENFYPRVKNKKDQFFKIVFYGTFIPVHGVEYIIKAANILKEQSDIKFEIIGSGQEEEKIKSLAKELNLENISFHDSVDYSILPELICEADVCLGLFGSSDKTKRAIPSKVYESMAMEKAVITGDSLAVREVFENKKHILLCNVADPESLANSIMELKKDEMLRETIAKEGYQKVKNSFSTEATGRNIKILILEIIDKYRNRR